LRTTSAGVAATLDIRTAEWYRPRNDRGDRAHRARGRRAGDGRHRHAYGATPSALPTTCFAYAAGAVGINIEDCVPGASELELLTLQTDKIATIAKAAITAGVRVVINARTDVYLRGFGAPETRLGVAIERGRCVPRRGSRLRLRAGSRPPTRFARSSKHRRTGQHPRRERLAVDSRSSRRSASLGSASIGPAPRTLALHTRHRPRAEGPRHLRPLTTHARARTRQRADAVSGSASELTVAVDRNRW